MKVKETATSYLTKKKAYTYEDYLSLPDDGLTYQVINGELVMTPAPATYHQKVSANTALELRRFVKKHKKGEVLYAPVDVVLSDTNVVQPDIVFISEERQNIVTEPNISGAPDLVVEILSPSTGYYDLVEKKDIYERFGVAEYWIVDPKKQWVELYVNSGGKFELKQRLVKSGVLQSPTLTGFEISLAQIFEV